MIPTTTDADLVALHLAGDRSGFAAIYDRYADRLYDTAAAMTGNRHDAADIVQDVFVTAAERLGQLRDATKLKPWLFAILRNEVYRRSRSRRRTVATDFSDPATDMAGPTDPGADGSNVEFDELASLVRAAAAGLDARDQLVLELSLRQGLEGDDLAAALGVSARQSYGLVHRMRQRTERSLGAYCVARAGRRDCPELAELLADWDGEFSVLVRKRVARHIDSCQACDRSRAKLAPFPLFGAAPVLVAPAELRDRVLGAIGTAQATPSYAFEAPGGFPSALRHGRRLGAWLLAASTALLLGAGAVVLLAADEPGSLAIDDALGAAEPNPPADPLASATTPVTGTAGTTSTTTSTTASTTTSTTTGSEALAPIVSDPTSTSVDTGPSTTATATATTTTTATASTTSTSTSTSTSTAPAPGSLALSAGTVDFGVSTDQVVLTLSNPGGLAVAWSTGPIGPAGIASVSSPFAVSPRSGSLAPGTSTEVTVTIDRRWPTEGPLPPGRITFSAPGTSTDVVLRGTIARAPAVRLIARPPSTICVWNTQAFFWQVAIDDESLPIRAQVEIVPPGGGRIAFDMQRDGDWFGSTDGNHDGDPNGLVDPGTHSWTVVAKDAFGNSTRVSGSTTVVEGTQNC